ncbi:MAG: MotA/TolQ/ExbB proton channel family protein [Isosphaerales bacterium]
MLKTCRRDDSGVAKGGLIRRALGVLLVAGIGLLGPGRLAVAPAIAQDRASPSDSAPASPDGVGSSSRADDEAPGIDGKSGTSRGNGSESLLGWIAHASAPVVIVALVIIVMSFYLGALVVWMALHYRTSTMVPPTLVRDVQDLLDQTKYNEAYHRLLGDSSFLARVLAAGVRKLPAGLAQAQRATELANEDATMEMEHRTTYLATVGTLGPMIGLVGTVYGMIMAFRVIALEGSSPQASQLAAGISTALYSTLFGIAISIPAIFFYAMFRNRIARLSLEVGMTTEPLLEQFAPGVRVTTPSLRPGPAPAAAAHPHPFAVSAALAAARANPPRPALPSSE